jgi:hypothetical protein
MFGRDVDGRARRAVLERDVDQVPHGLLDARRVAVHDQRVGANVDMNDMIGSGACRSHGVDGRAHDVAEVDNAGRGRSAYCVGE